MKHFLKNMMAALKSLFCAKPERPPKDNDPHWYDLEQDFACRTFDRAALYAV